MNRGIERGEKIWDLEGHLKNFFWAQIGNKERKERIF
jgi:hypothetical protein